MTDGHRPEGKIAIITGAARGIGQAIAEKFAKDSFAISAKRGRQRVPWMPCCGNGARFISW